MTYRRLAPQQRQLITTFAAEHCVPRALLAVRSDEIFDVGRLRDDIGALLRRYDALRTRFVTLPGFALPVQQDDDGMGYGFNVAADEQVIPLASADSTPDRPPLSVVCGEHILAITSSVLCVDSRSLDLILAAISGAPQRADFVSADSASDPLDGEEERDWWLRQRRPAVVLPFRRDLAGGPRETERQAVVPALAARVAAIAAEAGTTAPAFWLASWWLLLRRMTDEDLSIDAEFDGRIRAELEGRVGPLARRAPLVFAFRPDTSFRTLLSEAGTALRHGRDIQEHFDPGDSAGPGVGFAWRDVLVPIQGRHGRLTRVKRYVPYGKPALDLCLEHAPDGTLELSVLSDPASVSASDALRVRDLLLDLVETAAAHPDESLRRLPGGRSCASAMAGISASNELPRGLAARGKTVLDAIARTASVAPNSTAVVDSVGAITYRQLWDRAGDLASEIVSHGAGPERPVGLLAGRSVAAAVAIVAAWRCGAPYLPLELTLPPERIARLCSLGRLAVWVVDSEGVGRVPQDQPFVRADLSCGAHASDSAREASPGSCAYLIATSGTTGQPKLVAIEHRNLTAYRDAFMSATALTQGCRYALASGWATDLGLTMVVAALTTSGSLHIVPQPQLLVPENFGQFMRQHEIEVLKITPGHLATLLSGDAVEAVLPSRLLVLGGEQPPWSLVQQIAWLSPGLRVFNHYGPTETTIGAVAGAIDPSQAARLARPPLGRALPTVSVYVLSEELFPVPQWVPGQLYIGGSTVARGYVGSPGATAASFIPHPVSGERLYATGDRVRILGDGTLEFLGRADRQIKINGLRCNPAELEAALAELDGVQRAFVVAREHAAGGIRLAAYVMPSDASAWNPLGWRRALVTKLPPHLMPASITALGSVPLKDNGKLDVDRLPPEAAPASSGELNDLERRIAAIWCDVLGLAAVGPEDRFFELGGQSLDLVRVRQRLKRELQLDLPLPELFNHPTVRATAALAAGRPGEDVLTAAQERGARQRAALSSGPGKGVRDATR